jgi:hypothetical protein
MSDVQAKSAAPAVASGGGGGFRGGGGKRRRPEGDSGLTPTPKRPANRRGRKKKDRSQKTDQNPGGAEKELGKTRFWRAPVTDVTKVVWIHGKHASVDVDGLVALAQKIQAMRDAKDERRKRKLEAKRSETAVGADGDITSRFSTLSMEEKKKLIGLLSAQVSASDGGTAPDAATGAGVPMDIAQGGVS